jgi:branched-chain amino acid transport system ATP-binding protein
MADVLEVKGLCAGYGKVQVLDAVDLAVSAHEVVALVGPNGAGKTTLLKAISGMIASTSGSITFFGRELRGMAIEQFAQRGIAHVPEGRRLFPGLTVEENLLLGGWTRKNTDLSYVLELFPKLADRRRQIVGTMSGGEQQMCAIARGLMSRPALVMIDELSLGLAPIVTDEILQRLPDIAASGTSILLVEQDVDSALAVAERAYVLELGRIALSGMSAALLADARVQQAYLGVV